MEAGGDDGSCSADHVLPLISETSNISADKTNGNSAPVVVARRQENVQLSDVNMFGKLDVVVRNLRKMKGAGTLIHSSPSSYCPGSAQDVGTGNNDYGGDESLADAGTDQHSAHMTEGLVDLQVKVETEDDQMQIDENPKESSSSSSNKEWCASRPCENCSLAQATCSEDFPSCQLCLANRKKCKYPTPSDKPSTLKPNEMPEEASNNISSNRFEYSENSLGDSSASCEKRYIIEDDPLPGWTKEVKVDLSSKFFKEKYQKGNVAINYYAPALAYENLSVMDEGGDAGCNTVRTPLSSEAEIKSMLSAMNVQDQSIIKKFVIRKPYCVCHSDQHAYKELVECKYGKGGCNSRFHPSCMGRVIGDYGPDGIETAKAKEKMGEMGFICPLCTEEIESDNATGTYSQHTFLRRKEIFPKHDSAVTIEDRVQFKEFKDSFLDWGIVGIDRPESKVEVVQDGVASVETTTNKVDRIEVEYQAPYVPKKGDVFKTSGLGPTGGKGASSATNLGNMGKKSALSLLNRVFSMVESAPLKGTVKKSGHADDMEVYCDEEKVNSDPIKKEGGNVDFNDDNKVSANISEENDSAFMDDGDDFVEQTIYPTVHTRYAKFPSSLERLNLQPNEDGLIKVSFHGNFTKFAPISQELADARKECMTLDKRARNDMMRKIIDSHPSRDGTNIVSLPLSDGDIRICNVVSNTTCKSLAMKGKCGYCMGNVDCKVKLAIAKFGNISFKLHPQCNDAMVNNSLFHPVNDWDDSIIPGAMYEYVGDINPPCYLCGLAGGVLQYFQFQHYHNFPDMRKLGVVCHIPCIRWLSNNRLISEWVDEVDRKIVDSIRMSGTNTSKESALREIIGNDNIKEESKTSDPMNAQKEELKEEQKGEEQGTQVIDEKVEELKMKALDGPVDFDDYQFLVGTVHYDEDDKLAYRVTRVYEHEWLVVVDRIPAHKNDEVSPSGVAIDTIHLKDALKMRILTSSAPIPTSTSTSAIDSSGMQPENELKYKVEQDRRWNTHFGNVVWYTPSAEYEGGQINEQQSDDGDRNFFLPAYVYNPQTMDSHALLDLEKCRIQSHYNLTKTNILRSQDGESVHYIYLYPFSNGQLGTVIITTLNQIVPFDEGFKCKDRMLNTMNTERFQTCQSPVEGMLTAVRLAQGDAYINPADRAIGKVPNLEESSIITRTPFDIILSNKWNCSLCNNSSGLIARCPVSTCTVRAHPICAQIRGWEFCSISIKAKDTEKSPRKRRISDVDSIVDGKKDRNREIIAFMCSFHATRKEKR